MAVILICAIRESFLGDASVAHSVKTTYIAMLGDVAEFVWVQIPPKMYSLRRKMNIYGHFSL